MAKVTSTDLTTRIASADTALTLGVPTAGRVDPADVTAV